MNEETIFDRIKALTEQRGKKIVDVEADLGMSKNYLYKWKKSVPSSDKLAMVADYFNVTTDYLLGRPEKHKEDNSGLSENQKLVAYSIDPDISDEERKAIIEMVEAAKKFRRRI